MQMSNLCNQNISILLEPIFYWHLSCCQTHTLTYTHISYPFRYTHAHIHTPYQYINIHTYVWRWFTALSFWITTTHRSSSTLSASSQKRYAYRRIFRTSNPPLPFCLSSPAHHLIIGFLMASAAGRLKYQCVATTAHWKWSPHIYRAYKHYTLPEQTYRSTI